MARGTAIVLRHRLLLALVVVCTVATSLAVALAQPRAYEAQASLWFDRDNLGQKVVNSDYVPPAQAYAGVLRDLLGTHSFTAAVADRSGLTAYIQSHPTGTGPSGTLAALTGGYGVLPIDLQADEVLRKGVVVSGTGSQIVTVTFRHESPDVARGVAQAVTDGFLAQLMMSRQVQAKQAVDFYEGQVKEARDQLAAAEQSLASYRAAHPEQTRAGGTPDATMSALQSNVDLCSSRLSALTAKLDQASEDSAAASTAAPNGARIIDPARTPVRAVSRTKLWALALGGGLAVGLSLCALVVLLISLVDTTIRDPEEVRERLGLELVGTVGRIA